MASQLALLAAMFAVGLFMYERLAGYAFDVDSYLSIGVAVMGVSSWVLLKRRHYSIVAWLLVASLCAAGLVSAVFYGSVRTVNIVLVVVAQVGVGIFFGTRTLALSTAVAIMAVGLLTWAEAQGMLGARPGFEVGWRTWLTHLVSLAGTAVMMQLNRTQVATAQAMQIKEAEQRLQTQIDRDLGLERFQRFFQKNSTPFFIQAKSSGAIVDVNPAFEAVTGYRRDHLIDKRDGHLWLHDEQHAAYTAARRSRKRTGWMPVTLVTRDGRRIPLMVSSERDEDRDEGVVIGALRTCEEGLAQALKGVAAAAQ
ncbi:hypothetical protein NBRC116584_00740 [Hydrogenophaga sp. 5NK40-0174]